VPKTPDDSFHEDATVDRLRDELWARDMRIQELESIPLRAALHRTLRRRAEAVLGSRLTRHVRSKAPSRVVTAMRQTNAHYSRTVDILSPERAENPQASIVIPVHNQLDATIRCLESIFAHTHGIDYEIVLVDDASDQYVNHELSRIPHLNLVTLTTNVGYLLATTRGVEASHGEFVVLLNNDTEVKPGWLTAIIETFADSTVGAVGAKLLLPNDRTQEAGAIVWKDGNARHFGRGYSATHPEVSYARNVDYCSAACLALRRSTWDDIGGFDERFKPAYYEDVDLCFAIQARGLAVRFQPAAEVIHHEGTSHGQDVESGTKRYQEINRETFRAKWERQLADCEREGSDVRSAARRLCPKQTILVLDHQIPRPTEDAGSVRMMAILESLLELGYGVIFASPNESPEQTQVLRLGSRGIEVANHEHSFQEILKSQGSDIELAIISRPQISAHYLPDVRRYCPNAQVVFDMVDLHYLRELRRDPESATAVAVSNAFLELELAAMKASDATIVVSESDASEIRLLYPEVKTFVIPTINEIAEDVAPPAGREGILFVGSFNHPPNRDAARMLATEIFPLLRKEHPNLTLTIVGSNPTPEALDYRRLPGVVHVGYVEDIRPLFQQARCMVAPLTWGAGVKGKITHSLASGLPVVTTQIGIEGLNCTHGEHALIGASGEEMIIHVSRVLADDKLWRQLSECGQKLASEDFSERRLIRELRRIIADGESIVNQVSSLTRDTTRPL
jgi:GT2 family glycosyltransferase/glycosyltransferase involved in cell wall biosynthesis